MIYLYSGTPGSYKSFHAVKESINTLVAGHNLITNFPLAYEKNKRCKKKMRSVYEYVNNIDLTVDYLIDFAIQHHRQTMKMQTLVVIDEASIKFNSREFNNHDRLAWINFLANHRHFNYDVILIAQNDRMIDRQIRALIEIEYKHRAVKHANFILSLANLIFRGLFFVQEYWYPCKQKTASSFHLFNKKIADCYDTMGLFVYKQKQVKQIKDVKEVKNVAEHKDNKDNKTLSAKDRAIKKNMSRFVSVLRAYIEQSNVDC